MISGEQRLFEATVLRGAVPLMVKIAFITARIAAERASQDLIRVMKSVAKTARMSQQEVERLRDAVLGLAKEEL